MILSLYLFVALILVLLLVIGRKNRDNQLGKVLFKVGYFLFLTLLVELTSVGAYRILTGQWTFQKPATKNHLLYEHHPYLVAMPVKHTEVEYLGDRFTHNTFGFRGPEIHPDTSIYRIAAIGGSTTYGVGVDDRETWPYYLDSILGPGVQVFNLGVPGHSTVEHVIYSSLILPELQPDLVLYHTGINDIGKMHVDNLQADYSEFHAPLLFGATAQCYRDNLPRFGSARLLIWTLQYTGLFPLCPYHQMEHDGIRSAEQDPHAASLYQRNLQSLARNSQALGAQTIFVPQLLSRAGAESRVLDWWIPYVENEVLVEQLSRYNDIMREVAQESNAAYVDTLSATEWPATSFVDACHLNPNGNLELAELLARQIRVVLEEQ